MRRERRRSARPVVGPALPGRSDGAEGVDDDPAGVGVDDLLAYRLLALVPLGLLALVGRAVHADLTVLVARRGAPVERPGEARRVLVPALVDEAHPHRVAPEVRRGESGDDVAVSDLGTAHRHR